MSVRNGKVVRGPSGTLAQPSVLALGAIEFEARVSGGRAGAGLSAVRFVLERSE